MEIFWRRRAVLVGAVVIVAVFAMDLARAPDRQLTTRVMIGGVHAYQATGHRLIPRGQCKFAPTCSAYAEIVVREHGAFRGGWLAARRLIRCGPWTPAETKDPPPMRDLGSKSP